MSDKNEIVTIPLVAHENIVNRLYKAIGNLIIALVIVSLALVGYIVYDRTMDSNSVDDVSVSQSSQDNANNLYNEGEINYGGNTNG